MNTDRSFLGVGWHFPPEFNRITGGAKMVSAEEDISQSLEILLSTAPGERTMNPRFGCRLKLLVFEAIDEGAAVSIRDVIERAILFHEPRITVNRVTVDDAGIYDGRLDISIEYTIRSTNTRSNYVYPFYFREATSGKI